MKSRRLLLVLLLALGLCGCIKVDTGVHSPTVGQELIDLARAKDRGQISDEEWQQLRRKVLASF